MTFERQRVEIVEIDVDFCTLVYGTSPCTASLSSFNAHKCFNTFRTCQDRENYDRGTLTLRFARNVSGLPKTGTIFPVVGEISARPGRINLSGLDPRDSALGRRARVTVTLDDFVYTDALTDKYRAERVSGAAQFSGVGYDPGQRSTFFAKLMARNPYYLGRPLRIRRGYAGDALGEMSVEHYVISEWNGPDAQGRVVVTAQDPINLIDGRRAKAPAPSNGKLNADISAAATELTLVPAGVGSEYPASGRIAIGREIASFTRSGDVMTLVSRGIDGTEADNHDEGDIVQLCLRYENQTIAEVLHDLLTVQGPVDPAFVDLAAWTEEIAGWTAGVTLTRTLPKPTGIDTLVGEIQQLGARIWWDAAAQEIRLRADRPRGPDETLTRVTDDANILAASARIERHEDRRVSALYFYHGTLDPTDSPTSDRNYSKLIIAADPSSSSENEYSEDRIVLVYSPWFGEDGNNTAAGVIAERLVSRYRDTPEVISASLDAKDASIALADIVELTTYLLPSPEGEIVPRTAQVGFVERNGDRVQIEAEAWDVDVRFGFWMTDPQADYDTATDTEKAQGAFWIDEAFAEFAPGETPYYWY